MEDKNFKTYDSKSENAVFVHLPNKEMNFKGS
jgi:hypothetical protein